MNERKLNERLVGAVEADLVPDENWRPPINTKSEVHQGGGVLQAGASQAAPFSGVPFDLKIKQERQQQKAQAVKSRDQLVAQLEQYQMEHEVNCLKAAHILARDNRVAQDRYNAHVENLCEDHDRKTQPLIELLNNL